MTVFIQLCLGPDSQPRWYWSVSLASETVKSGKCATYVEAATAAGEFVQTTVSVIAKSMDEQQ